MIGNGEENTKFDEALEKNIQNLDFIDKNEVIRPVKEHKLFSLKNSILILAAICWIVPISIIFTVMSTTYREGIVSKTETILKDDVKNFSTTLSYNINEAIVTSKNISYEFQLERSYKNYKRGVIKYPEFYKEATAIVTTKFKHNDRFSNAVFYLKNVPSILYSIKGSSLSFYTENVENVAGEITSMDTPKAFVKVIDGKVYVIRNLYTIQGYSKFGTLVVELNTSYFFKDISKSEIYHIAFFINDETSVVSSPDNIEADYEKSKILELAGDSSLNNSKYPVTIRPDGKNKYVGYSYLRNEKDYKINTILITDKNIFSSELETLYKLIGMLILLMIPVFSFYIIFIRRNVTKPIVKLVNVSKEIQNGNIGIQIEGDRNTMPNREFAYLMVSFNKMSSRIKYLFDYAYHEQIARKNAKIIALQSQINPHFLNNTLEMMNWQARMAEDIPVVKMIEALSTLMDFTWDRSERRIISLSEEIHCADAYLYIISMRFGQRLKVSKEIDESLLQIQVPPLIIQPLLENAVLHGIEKIGDGTISLKVYKAKDIIKLEVINTGKIITKEDIVRMEQILSGKLQQEKGKGQYTSLGIQNVNERIKLIYGNMYGLIIKSSEEGVTTATITIPLVMEE